MSLAALLLAPPLPPAGLAAALLIVLAAGVVRGFAGFGFSALSVAGLSLLVSPALVVPAIFMLEIVASLSLLPGVRRDVDVPWLASLALGNAIAIPFGVALLAWLPEAPLRALIGALLLGAALLQRSGWHPQWQPDAGVRLRIGLASGLANGVAAIGGVVIAVLLSSTTLSPQALRATMVVLLLFTDVCALAWAGLIGLIGGGAGHAGPPLLGVDTLRWAVWLVVPMLAGIAIGRRFFSGVSPARFRARVLDALMLIAALTVLRALAHMAG